MKKILFALALVVAFDSAASAQTSRSSRTVRSRTTVTTPEATPMSRTTRTSRSVRVTTLPGAVVSRKRVNTQGYTRPSPYLGDATPANDGLMNNKQRNIRVNNTSEPLPTNSGW